MEHGNNLPSVRLVLLAAMAVAALWLSGMPFFSQEVHVLTSSGLSAATYRVATWGNTLVATAAALYVANLYLSLDAVGRWATRFAAAGAVLLAADAGAHMLGLGRFSISVEHSWIDFYDLISVLVPMAVISYLVVEFVNRNRIAGAFIMPVIICLIGIEMWLLAENAGTRSVLVNGFRDYWGHAYVVVHVIGYGAFALAAAVGLLHLLRHSLEQGGAGHRWLSYLPDSWRTQTAILGAIGVGVPVFALALFLTVGWGLGADMWKNFAWLKGLWVASALAFYGGFLYALYTRSMAGHRMAWWSVFGFAATLALFLGTHVLTLGVPPSHQDGMTLRVPPAAFQKNFTIQRPLPTIVRARSSVGGD